MNNTINPLTKVSERVFDLFVRQYIATHLWLNGDDDTEAFDEKYGYEDIDIDSLERVKGDCYLFLALASETIPVIRGKINRPNQPDFTDEEADYTMIAHDFVLTRNGHGAGFWDGDYPDAEGNVLAGMADGFKQEHMYLGDDGRIYIEAA